MARTLKITEEIRVDSESEAKDVMEQYRQDARNNGYTLSATGYTYKCKKSKGEIIDEGYIVKTTKVLSEMWGEE